MTDVVVIREANKSVVIAHGLLIGSGGASDTPTGTGFSHVTSGVLDAAATTLASLKTSLGLTGNNSGDQTITLTGDLTGSGTGSLAATLATVNSNVGSFTNASFTVNAKGLITAASSGPSPILTPTSVKTANYTAAAGELVLVDTSSGSITVQLPTAPSDKTQIEVKQIIRGGTNTVSVSTGGADVFNRAGGATSATLTLSSAAQLYQYQSSTGIWFVIADDNPYAALLANAQTWTGVQTFVAPVLGTVTSGNFSSGTFTWPTFNQNTSGSAATLTTPRAINGVNFDGSANIQITAGAGTLTGTTLASNVVTSSLTSVGTLASGAVPLSLVTGLGTGVATLLGGNATGSGAPVGGTAPTIAGGTHTALTSLGIRSTGAAFDLTLATAEVLTAGRTLSLVVGDAARTLTLFGSTTVPVATQQLTFAGPTAARTITFPDAAITVARSDAAQTFTGVQTFVAPILGTPTSVTLTNGTGLPPAGVVGTAAILGANTFTATQAVTEAVGSSALVLTGATQTGSFPVINATQTWNASGTTFTAQKVNVTNTASATFSLLQDWQVGGTSKAGVVKDGSIYGLGIFSSAALSFNGTTTTGWAVSANSSAGYFASAAASVLFQDRKITLGNTTTLGWSANTDPNTSASDLLLTRSAAATLQQGAANAASPIAQILQAQGSRSGTDSNTGGANYTVTSGNGTGTGTISSLILQSPVAVASGSGAQTMTTGLTIKQGAFVSVGYAVASLPASPATGSRAHVTDANATTFNSTVAGGGANIVSVFYNGSNWVIA